jgi:hypothetical protein
VKDKQSHVCWNERLGTHARMIELIPDVALLPTIVRAIMGIAEREGTA